MTGVAVFVLSLPELVLRISWHLDASAVLALSAVSRPLYASFAPLVWRNLHFGRPCNIDHDSAPFARSISLDPLPAFLSCSEKTEKEQQDEALIDLLDKTPWIRSLTIHHQNSLIPLLLGEACSRLEFIAMEGIPSYMTCNMRQHWKSCKRMIRRNSGHLRSLVLVNWESKYTKGHPKQRMWSPLLDCTQSRNLRSLSMSGCKIPVEHSKAFWEICEQLEKLTLARIEFDPSVSLLLPADATKTQTELSAMTGAGVRFPRLQELTLINMASLSGTDQLHLLICQCPALQTLLWRPTYGRGFPHAEFCALYIESKWPDLDSITFKAAGINIPEESHFRLLQVAKQPFRVLDYHLSGLGPRTLELLMDQHFATMQSIDLCYLGNAGKWAIKVLTSFPRLERFSAETIFASHILEGEPWVCHGLKELTVFIDMDVVERGQFRNQLSAKEIQQCRGIYRQLAALRELRVLDMLSKFDTIWGSMGSALKVPLPFCLDAGLELMAGSVKLKKFKLWPGREEVNERELAWILEHWKQLRRLDGGWCCTAEGGFFLSLAGEQKKLLNKHGINITEDTSDDRAVEARLRWNE